MHSYFTYGNQDAEINDTNSSWSETLFAVQKGSNIDRLLRYTFIWDLLKILIEQSFFKNWNSLHAKLKCQFEAMYSKEKKKTEMKSI